MEKRGLKPQKKVSTEWSPELAYVVGLITTDGCLSTDGRHLDFTSKDKELVIKFKRCLGLKNVVGRKTSGTADKKEYYRIQFGDVNFYGWLLGIGLSPRKSKIIGELKIPQKYFFDFLRGSFDGDGSIYAFWDPRWHSSYMFYLKFISASVLHLQWLQEKIARRTHLVGRIQVSTRSHQLVYAKAATRILFSKMFYSQDVPHLKRKYTKVIKIFRIDDSHNKKAQVAKLVHAYG